LGVGGTRASGGVVSTAPAGGSGIIATGGTAAAGGTGGTHSTTSTIDCSAVGCAAPPLCSTGCTDPCGCCPCSAGQTQGSLVCVGGCFAAVGGAGGLGGSGAGGNSAAGGASGAGGICGSGCTHPSGTVPFCNSTQVWLQCLGTTNSSILTGANNCSQAATDVISYCCPTQILTGCL
jgi:hypothetical protein